MAGELLTWTPGTVKRHLPLGVVAGVREGDSGSAQCMLECRCRLEHDKETGPAQYYTMWSWLRTTSLPQMVQGQDATTGTFQ